MVHSFGPESSASISAVSATEFLSKMAMLCVCLGLVTAGLEAFPVNPSSESLQRRPRGDTRIEGIVPLAPKPA